MKDKAIEPLHTCKVGVLKEGKDFVPFPETGTRLTRGVLLKDYSERMEKYAKGQPLNFRFVDNPDKKEKGGEK